MSWVVEYFERENTIQPAEVFEDELDRVYPQISGKLIAIIERLKQSGYRLGGGYIEKCRDYIGLWEIRVIYGHTLAREFFGFDGERIVLLHGYVKRVGKPASLADLKKAFEYWQEYQRTRHVSPVQEENNESI